MLSKLRPVCSLWGSNIIRQSEVINAMQKFSLVLHYCSRSLFLTAGLPPAEHTCISSGRFIPVICLSKGSCIGMNRQIPGGSSDTVAKIRNVNGKDMETNRMKSKFFLPQ